MIPQTKLLAILLVAAVAPPTFSAVNDAGPANALVADFNGYSRNCGIDVHQEGQHVVVRWPLNGEREDKEQADYGQLVLDCAPGHRLILTLGVSRGAHDQPDILLKDVDPVVFVTVGSRQTPPGKPPGSKWQVFFDKPADRPHETFRSKLELTEIKVESEGRRAAITLHTLKAGSFTGALQFLFYAGCPLVQVQAALSTQEDSRAILYDAALLGKDAGWKSFAWLNPEGALQRADAKEQSGDRPLGVKHRTIVAETEHGSLACFPPPHQYFFPRDLTTNLSSAKRIAVQVPRDCS